MPMTGADTLPAVTQVLIDQATNHLGVKPAFWGRYFGLLNPQDSYTKAEAAPLKANKILLMPIAHQTTRVNGSRDDGLQDGKANVDDLVKRVGSAC